MKKLVLASIFTFAAFLIIPQVNLIFAENSSLTTGPFSNKREQVKNETENRGELKVKTASVSAELRQKKGGAIKLALSVIVRRLFAANERLDKISDRIQIRINKLKDKGVDVSAAQSALDGCKVKAQSAKSAVADAGSKVNAIDTSSSGISDQVKAARSAIATAKQSVVDYYKCLGGILKTVRTMSPEDMQESSKESK